MINPNTQSDWRKDVKVMFNSDELHARISALASAITAEYPANTELCVIGILKAQSLSSQT